MKIDGARLDPKETYASEWVGDKTGGGETVLDGKRFAIRLNAVGRHVAPRAHAVRRTGFADLMLASSALRR